MVLIILFSINFYFREFKKKKKRGQGDLKGTLFCFVIYFFYQAPLTLLLCVKLRGGHNWSPGLLRRNWGVGPDKMVSEFLTGSLGDTISPPTPYSTGCKYRLGEIE